MKDIRIGFYHPLAEVSYGNSGYIFAGSSTTTSLCANKSHAISLILAVFS